jgi:hypothetical protein
LIPESVAALVAFLLLLAPGIVWQLLRERHVPAVKETTLIEASRVVLSSLAATGAAALILLLWLWLPIYRDLSEASEMIATADTVRYMAAVVANALLACGLVLIASAVRWPGRAPVSPGRVWNRAFARWVPAGGSQKPGVIIELTDGTIWRGLLWAFDSDPEDGNRNVAIGPPLRVKPAGVPKFERVAEAGDKSRVVLLPESHIRTMQVVYLGAASGAQSTGRA